jgi:hypothetical protein
MNEILASLDLIAAIAIKLLLLAIAIPVMFIIAAWVWALLIDYVKTVWGR